MPSGGELSGRPAIDGAALIGVDWGTSNLRVMRIAPGGAVLAARSDPRGAGGLSADAFASVLDEVAGAWLEGLPVLICGMAGGRGKWKEQPYHPCPVALNDLASGLVAVHSPGLPRIVSGVMAATDGRMTDVMRGEETQVAGLDLTADSRVVAPGTHGKWITIAAGRIVHLRSFVTGELFAALAAASGFGDPGGDPGAFEAGVRRAFRERDLTAALFSARVERLAGRLEPSSMADYCSGLLIGAEVSAQASDLAGPVVLVGDPVLNGLYAFALGLAGFTNIRIESGEVAAARGLWRIHEAAIR